MRFNLRAAVLSLGLLACAATSHAQTTDASSQARLLARGNYLMNSVVACGNCHTVRGPDGALAPGRELAGGLMFKEEPFTAYASNITPDPETGIGKWTDAQLKRAIREGIRPDGSLIGPPMPFQFYRGLADADLDAIVVYLRQVPPVRNVVPKSEYRIALPPAYGPPIKQKVVAPSAADPVRYGAYLAGPLGHCMDCHTPMGDKGMRDMARVGAGGFPFPGPWGVSVARNLTPHATGLAGWSDAEIAKAIRTGERRNGEKLKPPMAYDFYSRIDERDMRALVAYLKSLKPLPMAAAK